MQRSTWSYIDAKGVVVKCHMYQRSFGKSIMLDK